MSYNKSPFKMAPKSPLTKALKGNQGKLPQHLQEAIKAAPESPAKAMMGPGVQKEANKTGTAGANSAKGVNAKKPAIKPGYLGKGTTPAKPAQRSGYALYEKESSGQMQKEQSKKTAPSTGSSKPKWDKELNSLVASRKGLKKGTAEYNKVQNRINEKLGSSVRRRTEETTKVPAKKTATTAAPKVNKALTPKPSAVVESAKPAKPAKKSSSRVTQTANRATVVTKSNGVKKKETINKNTGNKKVVVKDANTRTVTKTNKAGESTTKTTKRIGKGRIKGAIKDARLARLDKKATRQAAKAADKKSKSAGKLGGYGK